MLLHHGVYMEENRKKKGSYRTLEAKVKIEYICIVAIIEEVSVDRADNT
jgi:hypothetical protein